MLFLFYQFYNLAFNALLYFYPIEALPFPIRAKSMSALVFRILLNRSGISEIYDRDMPSALCSTHESNSVGIHRRDSRCICTSATTCSTKSLL